MEERLQRLRRLSWIQACIEKILLATKLVFGELMCSLKYTEKVCFYITNINVIITDTIAISIERRGYAYIIVDSRITENEE